jgi:low temperature requirement protein LtrA
LAFALAFFTTAAYWWLYFSYVARIAERRLELSTDRTRLARDGYTYLHVLMVAGIVLSAVGDELVIAHPNERLPTNELVIVTAGPAVYLLAHVLFRLRVAGSVSGKRLAGACACVAAGVLGTRISAIALAGILLAILVTVIASEHLAAARRRARGEPSPLQRLETNTASRSDQP